MGVQRLCSCMVLLVCLSLSVGIRLYPCGGDGYQDVEENTPITFYCDQYGPGTVSWTYQAPASDFSTAIASCTDTYCGLSSYWTVTYISAGNSSLTTSFTSRTFYSGSQYACWNLTCRLHVIVPAEVSHPTTNITRQVSGYTLSVSADVTHVYSSRGQYSCIWQLGSSSHTTQPDLTPPASDVSNTANRTGKCDVTMPLPVTSGTYPCSVTVTPGNTQRSCGSITITPPPPPTISCPSDLIPENTSFTCICDTSNIGQPGGRLRWYTGSGSNVNNEVISGSYDINTLAMTRTVTRGDNNVRKFRCVNNWTVNVPAQSDYTARVAWGPDTVDIQGNTTFYTDSSGSRVMTLTCQANGFNPSPNMTYIWDKLCDDRQQSTCTFKPGPGDDNRVIGCTVTNVNNNNRQQYSSVTLDIKYPPLSAPLITGNNGGVLYKGDRLILTCAVTGGNPVVTSVTLSCPDRHKQSTTSGQVGSLVISPLSAADHNLTCMCRSQWVREDDYTLTDSVTLTVFYPPSTPIITRTDGQSRPALEGDAVTLTCSLTSSGNPPAEVTWKGERSNVKVSVLRLEKVGKRDNQRNLTCQASNAFTQHKGQQLADAFTLDVYYGPYITIRPGEDNRCVMTSDDTACHVTEGQRVHLRCDVDSNPAPRNCTWRFLSGSDNVLDLGTDLDIVATNRTDGGVYQVQVETTKPDVTDDRLPLIGRRTVTVLVKSKTTETKLLLNNKTAITVNEKEAVTVTCQTRDQPSHRLVLLQRNVELARQDGSHQLSLSGEVTLLSHDMTARCDNTGIVTCRSYNWEGTLQHVSEARLYVNCKPRRIIAAPMLARILFIDRPVSAAFYMEALPLPDRFTFQYLGSTRSSNSSLPVPASIGLRASCANTYAKYAVRCQVSVDRVLDSTEAQGFYTFTAANGFGEDWFMFKVAVNDNKDGGDDASG